MSIVDWCADCGLAKTCLWSNLPGEDRRRLLKIIHPRDVVHDRQSLYRAGEPIRALYILRSGTVKAWNVSEDGEEHIIRFYMPGEVLGLGAISMGYYDCHATSLDTSSVCEIPFGQFQKAAEETPSLNQQLLRMMSLELVQEEQMMVFRGNRSASARIASFLDYLAQGHGARGYSTREFNLTMGRRDIANYLGLALETVSRTFTSFQERGMLEVDGRRIVVKDQAALHAEGGGQSYPSTVALAQDVG